MDSGTLEQVLYHIHNWFERESIAVKNCEIVNGSLPGSVTSGMLSGQYYRIVGSYMNDGLHQNPDNGLTDETFSGVIYLLAIPKALIAIVEEIDEWIGLTQDAREKALSSPYQSESFGGYSYNMKGGGDMGLSSGDSSKPSGWKAEFASRLNDFRKIC